MVDGTLSNCYLYDIVPLSENKAYNLFYFINGFMSPVRTNIPDFQLDFLEHLFKTKALAGFKYDWFILYHCSARAL